MKKSLYICGDKYKIMLDGPSLWVEKEKQAGFRIPLRILDYVFIDKDTPINYEILMALFLLKIPVAFYKNGSHVVIHTIPYYDSGYFYDINQRLGSKKESIRAKLRFYIAEEKRENQLELLKELSDNLSKAFSEHFFRENEYLYEIIKHCNCERKKLFTVKKILRSLLRQLITKKCIDHNLDPKTGIIHEKDALGMVKDISVALDPQTDAIALAFLKIKQNKLWSDEKTVSKEGMKMLSTLFEQKKEKICTKTDKIIEQIITIISTETS